MALHPNIVQTQNRMRGIPDAQLQQMLIQMTQTGKVGTPEYLMAAGEMQARKDIRAKANVPQANPQPVIADLLTAGAMPPAPMMPQGMPAAATPQTPAPEDAGGIAAMEAPNMESIDMMGGGLVAFGDGGEVPRYQNQGLVTDPFDRFFGDSRRPMPLRYSNFPASKTQPDLADALTPEEVEQAKKLGIFESFEFMAAGPEKKRQMLDSLANQSAKALQTGNAMLPGAEKRLATSLPSTQDMAAAAARTRASMTPEGRAQYLKNLTGVDVAGLPAVAAAGTPGAPAAGDQPTVRLKSDDTSGLPAIVAPTYGDAMALGRQFAGSTADIEKQLKELPTEKQAAQSQFDVYKEMGVDLDPYKSLKASLEKEKSEEGKAKTEAGLMRLAEFGFNWASQSGPALQAAAKAGKEVAPGLMSDYKELNKLSRERNKTLADIAAIDSKMRKDVTDAGLAKLQKRRDSLEKRRDEINDNAARIGGTIYGQQLASQTQMATTGMTTRATIAKLEQQLGTDRAAKIVGIAEKLLAQNKMYPAMTPAEQDAAFKQAVQQAMSGMATAETTVTPRS